MVVTLLTQRERAELFFNFEQNVSAWELVSCKTWKSLIQWVLHEMRMGVKFFKTRLAYRPKIVILCGSWWNSFLFLPISFTLIPNFLVLCHINLPNQLQRPEQSSEAVVNHGSFSLTRTKRSFARMLLRKLPRNWGNRCRRMLFIFEHLKSKFQRVIFKFSSLHVARVFM